MIIQASQRANEKGLADHLMDGHTNEPVSLYELRGFSAQDLHGAMQEVRAQSLANKKIKKTLFSVSFNSPIGEKVTTADFVDAANRAEAILGLTNQPRAIVFHEKHGRIHAHTVWSRIDEHHKAIKLPFYKRDLNRLSRDLFLEHGWALPKGYTNQKERDKTCFNLAEWQIAKRQQSDPKIIKAQIQQLWKQTKGFDDFQKGLAQMQFVLAKGTKPSVVLVDIHGDVRSLSRTLSCKAKEVKSKLGSVEQLPSVEEAKCSFAPQLKAEYTQKRNSLINHQQLQLEPHTKNVAALTAKHKAQRLELAKNHKKRQLQERNARQALHQHKGLKALWFFVSGQYHKLKKRHEAEYIAGLERDANEVDTLVQTQMKQREALQQPIDAMNKQHQAQITAFNERFVESTQTLGIENELTAHMTKEQALQRSKNIQRPEWGF